MRPIRSAVALCAVTAALVWGDRAAAAAPAGEAVERERIASERAVVETRFAEERLACQQNFVVTSCVDAARRREREALGNLRRQEAILDESQRRQRAAERVASIRAKVSAEEARQREQAAQPRRESPLQMKAPSAGPVSRAASAPAPQVAPVPAAAEREVRENRSKARFEARQRDAREHREAAQRRSAQRSKPGQRTGTPLPAPSGASAP